MRSFYLLLICLLTVSTARAKNSRCPTDYVNMFMGVSGNSNCVIGPQLPHGSINPSPQTAHGGQNGYKKDDLIRGFGQLHVSGIGWSRYGQIFLSPQIGFKSSETGHDSKKSEEIATPYYYKVVLNRYNIKAEVSPTHHAAIYRFTYPDKGDRNILLDIRHNIPQDIVPEVKGKFLGGNISYNPSSKLVTGWGEYAGGFGSASPYKVYFAVSTDDPNAVVSIHNNKTKSLYARLHVDKQVVNLKIAVSLKSIENAERYLDTELYQQDLERIKMAAKAKWNDLLGTIDVKSNNDKELSLFYTAFYHSMVMPRDRSGDNPRWDSALPHIDDHYCLWDTWRTVYPLLTLVNTSFVSKTINSFIDRFRHDGKCTPTFTSSLEWDQKQGGDEVDNVIADAISKNIGGFDKNEAYAILKWNALHARCPEYLQQGWIGGEHKQMSCSYTMEYAYNDNCVYRMARLMGDTATARIMEWRMQQWTNLFNTSLESNGFKGFIGPKTDRGEFIAIDPAHVYGSWVEYFYEGNSWTYTLFTPGMVSRLIALCGGKSEMAKRLQYGFEHHLVDLSNEPGFLTPFIFNHCDRPDLTANAISQLRQTAFSLDKGYPDNEDSGAMGSWYVFTSIGLFPNAGQDYYYLIPPAFDDVVVTMENGKRIHIKVKKSSWTARYISRIVLNGKTLDRSWISHSEITEGATIEYELSDSGNQWRIQPFEVSRREPIPFGVNLAGAEFFHHKMNGVGHLNKDYFYPSTKELDYWAKKGMKLIRLPFKWERIQHEANGPLNMDEVNCIKDFIFEANRRGMKVLLDMHNYGRRNYNGKNRIIGDSLPTSYFAHVWAILSQQFKDCEGLYGYGLCNEPHDMATGVTWKSIAQEAIDSIRKYDRLTTIVVGGNHWSSAERWQTVSDDLKNLTDPSDNLVFEAHCYFDHDGSGIYRKGYDEEGAYPTVGIDRVRPFVDWLQRNHKRGFVGEYGVPGNDSRWLECLDLFLAFLTENGVNGTYWAAGSRWNKYILGVHPVDNYSKDQPQTAILTKYQTTH